MKRIVSMLLAVLLLCASMPTSLFAVAEGADGNAFILPTALTKIEEQAFAGNTMVTTMVVPNTVKAIGSRAFEGCTGLTEVVIASRDIAIADDAFQGCSRDMVFYAYSDSDAMLWAMAHGYVCEPLDDGADYFERFEKLIAHSGFNSSMLQSGAFASMCVIVRTNAGDNRLPDISAYHPVDIFRSEDNLYYIQFASEGEAEDCHNMLRVLGLEAEPDRIGANSDVFAQGVTIAEFWGTNDTMGFDDYAPFVAERASGNVTIAVIDSGVSQSSWGGSFSSYATSLVGGSPYTDSARHGSKVVSIINDCVGDNTSHLTLLPIKVVNSSSMYRTSVIIEGIKHAINHNADIINLSLGWDVSEGTSPEIAYQISRATAKGVHVVAAAGNGSGKVMFPANCDGVLAVSALTYSTSSGYSVRSRTGSEIDYTAPGIYLSTSSFPNIDLAGDVTGSASTSFAAPQISAALALIKLDPTRGGNAVSVLDSTCMDLGAEGLSSSAYGRGLPQLDKLAVVPTEDIVLKNMDEGPIPTRLWLGDKGNNFLLSWEIVPANASNQTVSVTSSDTSVVAVQQFGNTNALITAKGVGDAIITITNDSVTKQLDLVVEQPVTEILITGAAEKLIVGKEMQLASAVLPGNAGNKSVTWKTSNADVATVTQEGRVLAKKTGQVTITCEAQDGYGTSAKVDIEVIDVPDATSIVLSAKEKDIVDNAVTLELGESLTLEVTVLPEDAAQEVYYSIFPQGIVTVSENGVVKAVAPGNATIMVTASSGKNVFAGLAVAVVISPESVSVSAEKAVLDIGDTTVMSGTVLPENATDKTITWISRNPAVATVHSTTGLVTAIAPGTAEITGVAVNGKQASATITVRKPITITFNPNDGVCGEASRVAYSGYEVGALPEATRIYWAFKGWYTAKSGGTKATAESVFTEDTTLYAQWTGLPYTVTFNANGGECAAASMSGQVGTKLGSLPAATRENYAFKGWYTMPGDGGTEVTADYTQFTTDALVLYAHWTAKPYAMTFNANGGECETREKTGTVDSPIGVLPVPTRAHYIFDGWYTASTGGTQITKEYVQSTTASITVYAHWTPMPYTMTFDANGGTCSQTEKECLVDTNVGELPIPTRSYYTFSGWYTVGENPIHVTASYQQAAAENVTVAARWTANPYTITFDANSGSCSTQTKTAYVDTVIGELPVPTRSYYTFEGWYTAATGGAKVTADYVQATDKAITVYARWTPDAYTITFDANSGSCSTQTKTAYVDIAIGELPVPTRSCYTFTGWYTAASGGTEITAAYVQRTDQAITVYAQWTPGTYDITLNANGGSCSTTGKTGTVDTAIGTLPTPTRDYYTFDGWYTAASGGTKVDAAYVQSDMAALTLYAHWTPMKYQMEFRPNGDRAETPVTRADYTVDTAVGTLPTPTRPYYTFDGWYTAASGGTRITTSYAHATTNTITVYAHWIPHSYTMYFNANEGVCATASKTGYVDTKFGTLPTPTRDYYTFDGWYTAATGGDKVTEAYLQETSASITVYAHWKANAWSAWVAPDAVPANARVVNTKWTYTERCESFETALAGWTVVSSAWKQVATGSRKYAEFTSGYDTSNSLYKQYNVGPYSAYENATEKRTVTNKRVSYIYWHWMYDVSKANGFIDRAIYFKKATGSKTETGNNYAYKYFEAYESTESLSKNTSGNWNQDDTLYAWYKSYKSGYRSGWFYRTNLYESTYVDYKMLYQYTRKAEATVEPTASDTISNIVKLVQYQLK